MKEDTFKEPTESINSFFFLLLLHQFGISFFFWAGDWSHVLFFIFLIIVFLQFAHKNFKIPVQKLLFTEEESQVTLADGLLTVCLFVSLYSFLLYLTAFNESGKNVWLELSFPNLVALILLEPVLEEIIYRFIGLRLLQGYGRTFAVLITSFLCALPHSHTNFITSMIVGIFYALIMLLTNQIWYSILFNIIFSSSGAFVSILFPNVKTTEFLLAMGIVCLIPCVFILRRPVFKQLMEWCNPKRIWTNMKEHEKYFEQLAKWPGFWVTISIYSVSLLFFNIFFT